MANMSKMAQVMEEEEEDFDSTVILGVLDSTVSTYSIQYTRSTRTLVQTYVQ